MTAMVFVLNASELKSYSQMFECFVYIVVAKLPVHS